MGQYSEGWITVPGKGKTWRTSEGKYSYLRPGFGSQTLGATGTSILNLFRGDKVRAFPKTFKDAYDADPAYSIPEVVIEPSKNQKPDPTPDPTPEDLDNRLSPTTQRTNELNVVQSGRSFSPPSLTVDSANEYLSRATGGYVPGLGMQTQTLGLGQPNSQTMFSPASEAQQVSNNFGANANNPQYLEQAGGIPLSGRGPLQNPGVNFGESPDLGVADKSIAANLGNKGGSGIDTSGITVEMTPERRELMRRAAFLDAPDSQSGLRAVEAMNNTVYAGGQYNIMNPEGSDTAFTQMSPSDYRDNKEVLQQGPAPAQAMLKSYADSLRTPPAATQSPVGADQSQMFNPNATRLLGQTTASGMPGESSVEFVANNAQPAEAMVPENNIDLNEWDQYKSRYNNIPFMR